jgi:hypothetical protein
MSLKEIMTSLITSPIKIMIKQKHLKINLTIMSPLVDKLADRCLPTATTKVKSTTKATRRTNLTTWVTTHSNTTTVMAVATEVTIIIRIMIMVEEEAKVTVWIVVAEDREVVVAVVICSLHPVLGAHLAEVVTSRMGARTSNRITATTIKTTTRDLEVKASTLTLTLWSGKTTEAAKTTQWITLLAWVINASKEAEILKLRMEGTNNSEWIIKTIKIILSTEENPKTACISKKIASKSPNSITETKTKIQTITSISSKATSVEIRGRILTTDSRTITTASTSRVQATRCITRLTINQSLKTLNCATQLMFPQFRWKTCLSLRKTWQKLRRTLWSKREKIDLDL